jgi:hypothetical protein
MNSSVLAPADYLFTVWRNGYAVNVFLSCESADIIVRDYLSCCQIPQELVKRGNKFDSRTTAVSTDSEASIRRKRQATQVAVATAKSTYLFSSRDIPQPETASIACQNSFSIRSEGGCVDLKFMSLEKLGFLAAVEIDNVKPFAVDCDNLSAVWRECRSVGNQFVRQAPVILGSRWYAMPETENYHKQVAFR